MVNVLGRFRRYWIIASVSLAIALMLMSLIGCTTLTSSSVSPSHRTRHILEFVPKQSLFTAVIDARVNSNQIGRSSSLAAEFKRVSDSVFRPLEIDFENDVRPWLGNEIVFAITDKDLDRNQLNGRQTGYLLVADIADSEQLREFLELYWQRQAISGHPPILSEDSGVPIIAGDVLQGNRQLATAVVGDNILLVGNNVKVLQQSLRVAQAHDLQLVGNDCCSTTWVTLRLPDFLDWLGVATPNQLPLMSTLQWQQLQAAIDLSSQQIVIRTVLTGLNNSGLSASSQGSDVTVSETGPSQYMPADAAWVALGNDLPQLWTELNNELAHYQQLPSIIQQKQQWLSTQLAQSLEVPLTQLLADDYAIAQLADGDWLWAVDNSQSPGIKQLDTLATKQGLTVSQLSLKGHPVTVWSRLKTRVDTRNRETTVETEVVGVHAQIDTTSLFSTSLAGLTKALTTPTHQLSTTQQFQHGLQSMNKPNQGYFYGTWSKLERLLENNRWFSLVKPILQPWSQSIDAIAITSYGQTTNESTGTILILLKN